VEEERGLRVGLIVAGHLMWVSTAALRLLHSDREREHTSDAPRLLHWYPPLVWIPLLVATFSKVAVIELPEALQIGGLALAVAAALFGATAMWSLGRAYAVRLDTFKGYGLRTGGIFAVCRHPYYLAIILYHLGASAVLGSLLLLAATAWLILPYTIARIVAEERLLERAFPEFAAYRARTPELLPFPR